jgi:hypothetical protein
MKKSGYQDAINKSLKSKWLVKSCFSGDDCWCKIIVLETPIIFDDDQKIEYIVGYGSVSKEVADHIVFLHNQSL